MGCGVSEHRYGYALDEEGQLITGSCSQALVVAHVEPMETSHQCHGEFFCVGCLQVHAQELQASGQTATFVGQLNRVVEDTDADA